MVDEQLEKIDMIVERTGVSYKEAKEALEKANGNVVDALIYIEENRKSWTESFTVAGTEVMDKIKDLIKKGNVTKIKIKKDDKVLLEIPVTAGAISTVVIPQLTLLGAAVAFLANCTIEVEKYDKSVIVLKEEKKND
jgi:phage terminase large subunit-like protein